MRKTFNRMFLLIVMSFAYTCLVNARVLNMETTGVSETSSFYGGTIARNKVESKIGRAHV